MAKHNESYGFDVRQSSGWAYPEGRAPAANAAYGSRPRQEYGYDAEGRMKAAQRQVVSPRSTQQRRGAPTAPQQKNASYGTPQRPATHQQAARQAGQSGRAPRQNEDWAYPSVTPHANVPAARPVKTAPAPSRSQYTPGSAQSSAGNAYRQMTPEQKRRYAEAYEAKHGISPYARSAGAQPVREDRRAAFLRDEELRRQREEALRRQQEEERRRAEYEEKLRRDEAARREADERRRAENAKRREEYERRRAEEEKRREALRRRREEEEKRRMRELELEKKRRRRHTWRSMKYHAGVFIAAAIITLLAAGAICYALFWSKGGDDSKSFTYYYGSEKISGISPDLANPANDARIDFTRLADMMGFYTVSDGASFKYIVTKGDENDPSGGTGRDQFITFEVGTNTASVNGTSVSLSSASVYTAGSLWVSDDIMDCFTAGIEYTVSGRKITLSKVVEKDENDKNVRDENGNYVYVAPTLKYSLSNDLTDVNLDDIYGKNEKNEVNGTASEVTFKADLSEFEEYMNPEDAAPYLTLVNRKSTVDQSFVPENLTDVVDTRSDREARKMCLSAEKALEAMFIELRENGYTDLSVTSGYRSYEEQDTLYNSYINQEMAKGLSEEDAKKEVDKYSAAPGTSEHQTGLCCDMHNLSAADQAFKDEPAYTWLKENCWKFGFILRFPEGKEDITGYEFEPWHYRFVGRYTAEQIHNQDMCLEEYLETIELH